MRRISRLSFVIGLAISSGGLGCSDATGPALDAGTLPTDAGPVPSPDGQPDSLAPPDVGDSKGLEWQEAEVVASGSDLSITFNNTRIGARDELGVLHLVWTADKALVYGRQATSGGTFQTQKIATLTPASQISKPTVSVAAGGVIIVAWLEAAGAGKNTQLAVTESADFGATFSAAVAISAADEQAINPSLHAFGASGGSIGALLAWGSEKASVQTIAFSRREGPSVWDAVKRLDGSGLPARDVGLHARDNFVVAAWEEEDGGTEIVTAMSSDGGKNWSAAQSLPLDTSNKGGDPSVFVVSPGTVYLAYQQKQEVHLVRSLDAGQHYSYLGALGNGLFPHVDGNTEGTIAVAWEHFKGNMKDNTIKTVGLTVSLDNWQTHLGPHAMPSSDTAFGTMLGGVSLSSQDADVFWLRIVGDQRELMHRRAILSGY